MRRASAGRAVACAGRLGASCSVKADGRPISGGAARRASQRNNKVDQELRRQFQEEVSMSFRISCAAAGAVLMTLAPAALAQDWPSRSIVAVGTVGAGNAAATAARIRLAQGSDQTGQSVRVEERPRR